MNILSIAVKNLIAKRLNTSLSVLLFALGVALVSLMLLLERQLNDKLNKNLEGINLVIGAKGSPLQMILSSVFHIDVPTGNIPLSQASKIAKIKTFVGKVIPQSLGDNYEGFRIVGTTYDYPEHYGAKVARGRLWIKQMEVVIGQDVAAKTGLLIGSTFAGAHGVVGANLTHSHDDHLYKVVGILERSNTVMDALILTNLESVWLVHEGHEDESGEEIDPELEAMMHQDTNHAHGGHAHAGHDHGHDGHSHAGHDHSHDGFWQKIFPHTHEEDPEVLKAIMADTSTAGQMPIDTAGKEVTSLLVFFAKDQTGQTSSMANVQLPQIIDEYYKDLSYAFPLRERNRLLENMGLGLNLLIALAFIFIFVSGLSVFISLYNSLKERKFELAQMRVMGASASLLLGMVMLEGILIAVIGYALGIFLSHTGMWVVSGMLQESYNYTFSGFFYFLPNELWLMLGSLLVGVLASLLPAVQAYRTDISRTLSSN